MRELHVVAVSEDGRHVLLAGKKGSSKGGFRVALDDRLLAAARGELRAPGEEPEGPELTPKDIQARLRAGESAESIARSAGVPLPRVERFSGPVQGEMARMIDAARSAHLVRGRLGRSALPLGRAVESAIAQSPSLREDSVEWETFREPDGTWRVTVSWFARARVRTAAWLYDPATKTVTATDPASAALGHADPDAPARPRPSAGTTTAATPAPPRAAKKAPAAKKSAPAAKKAAPKKAAPAAKKAAPKKAAAKAAPAARKAAPTKKVAPAKKAAPAARKAAAKKAAPTKVATAARKAAPTARKSTPPKATPAKARLRVVPDPAPEPTSAPAKARAADRDGVTTRASVPAWADVLLGTTPGGDR